MFGDSNIHSRHPSVVAACPNPGHRVTGHLPVVPQRMPDVACSSYLSLTLSHPLVLFLLSLSLLSPSLLPSPPSSQASWPGHTDSARLASLQALQGSLCICLPSFHHWDDRCGSPCCFPCGFWGFELSSCFPGQALYEPVKSSSPHPTVFSFTFLRQDVM